jgi:pimeloyl-[acyl-carrier protein] methyl ester esterase
MNKTTVVLLPGLDGTGALFRPLISRLPSHLVPVVVSYPGDVALGYQDLLPLVMQALPNDGPFVILGESFSGPLALMAASTCPPGLKGVVLCATFVENPLRFKVGWLRHLVRPIFFRLYPEFSRAKALLGRYGTSELRSSIAKALAMVRPEVFAHRVREVLQVDVTPQLRSCSVPILYLRGNRDFVVWSHNARRITNVDPTIKLEVFDAPHMILQTQPLAAATSIDRFVRASYERSASTGSSRDALIDG